MVRISARTSIAAGLVLQSFQLDLLTVSTASPNASNSVLFTGFVCGSNSACHWTPRANPEAFAILMASTVPSSANPSTTTLAGLQYALTVKGIHPDAVSTV